MMKGTAYYIGGLASLLHTVFFTFLALKYKNVYASIVCMVIIAVFVVLFIVGVGREIHSNPPIDNTYRKTVLGHDFLFAKFRWFGVDVIRVYSVYANKYFYAKATDVQGISDWIAKTK